MHAAMQQVAMLKRDLTAEERAQFDVEFASRRRNPTTALVLGIFLGMLGIDRFYLGQVGLGCAKLLTLGGLGVWQLIDLFLITGVARQRNAAIARRIHEAIKVTRVRLAA